MVSGVHGIILSVVIVLASSADPHICTLPVQKGPCSLSTPYYYYNTDSGRCEQFSYSGCGGNENRFVSETECIQSCACQMKPDAGTCKGMFEKWYYNSGRGCCEKFYYGGCVGNANNFNSYEECTTTCGGSFVQFDLPRGSKWGTEKITAMSGDRSSGGTFGKVFGGSRTVHFPGSGVPNFEKDVMNFMNKHGPQINLPSSKSSLQIIGKEITGPGLVQSEKSSNSWSSGPITTGVKQTVQMSSGPLISGMSGISGVMGSGSAVVGGGGGADMLSGAGGLLSGLGDGNDLSSLMGGSGGSMGGFSLQSGMSNGNRLNPGGVRIPMGNMKSGMAGGKISSQIQPPWMGNIAV